VENGGEDTIDVRYRVGVGKTPVFRGLLAKIDREGVILAICAASPGVKRQSINKVEVHLGDLLLTHTTVSFIDRPIQSIDEAKRYLEWMEVLREKHLKIPSCRWEIISIDRMI